MLILVVFSAEAQSYSLLEKLGLADGDYWVASNGVALPLAEFAVPDSQINEVLLLRLAEGGLQPVGWYEVSETDLANAGTSPGQLTLDSEPPQAELKLNGQWIETAAGSTLAAADAKVMLSFQDPAGLRDWVLTDSHRVSSTGNQWAEGAHRLLVRAADGLGNQGTAGRLEFEVDASGPDMSWQILSDSQAQGRAGPIYAPPVSVRLSASDPAGLSLLEVDSGDGWQGVSDQAVISLAASGLRLRGVDGLGNTATAEASWQYDLEAPQIVITVEGQDVAQDNEIVLPVGGVIEINVMDDGVGVDSATYQYNRRPPKALPETIRFVDRGWYQMEIRAQDKLGNLRVRHIDIRTSPRAYRPRRAGAPPVGVQW